MDLLRVPAAGCPECLPVSSPDDTNDHTSKLSGSADVHTASAQVPPVSMTANWFGVGLVMLSTVCPSSSTLLVYADSST